MLLKYLTRKGGNKHKRHTSKNNNNNNNTNNNNIQTYYNQRKHFHYYKKVKAMLNKIKYSSIIDIGSRKSPMFEGLDDTIYKAMLDIKPIPPHGNVHMITADFYTWVPDREYDVALCLQVLEHLDRPKEFVDKLFQTAKTVVISVPYMWPKGSCKYHVQDPINEEKIFSWTGKEPDEKHIITDGKRKRIVCLYRNTGTV